MSSLPVSEKPVKKGKNKRGISWRRKGKGHCHTSTLLKVHNTCSNLYFLLLFFRKLLLYLLLSSQPAHFTVFPTGRNDVFGCFSGVHVLTHKPHDPQTVPASVFFCFVLLLLFFFLFCPERFALNATHDTKTWDDISDAEPEVQSFGPQVQFSGSFYTFLLILYLWDRCCMTFRNKKPNRLLGTEPKLCRIGIFMRVQKLAKESS